MSRRPGRQVLALHKSAHYHGAPWHPAWGCSGRSAILLLPWSAVMREARALSVLVVAILLGSWPARAAPAEGKPPAREGLPADLDLVPRDAAGFVHVRLTDVWQSAWVKDIRLLVDRAGPEAWAT